MAVARVMERLGANTKRRSRCANWNGAGEKKNGLMVVEIPAFTYHFPTFSRNILIGRRSSPIRKPFGANPTWNFNFRSHLWVLL